MNRHSKPRESRELLLLRALRWRMELPVEAIRRFERLLRGYEGELAFYDVVRKKFSGGGIVLYDLLFEWGGRRFQVDSLLIYNDAIWLFEVKNFEGDYFIQDEEWFSVQTKKEIANPILQLRRSDHLFRGLLSQVSSRYLVRSSLVFIHPGFFLYNAPVGIPVVFAGQLKRFFEPLKQGGGIVTEFHRDLAKKLVEQQVMDNSFERVPEYRFADLKKGVPCAECGVFMNKFSRCYLKCPSCGYKERNDKGIIRITKEFILLFPDTKITSSYINNFSGNMFSLPTIRRALEAELNHIKQGRSSHFKFNSGS